MKPSWPRSLSAQVALASFAVLLLVQVAGLWLLLDDRGRLNYKLLAEYSAQRMAGYAQILDRAGPAERPALVDALSVQPTGISLAVPWETAGIDDSADARDFIAQAQAAMDKPLPIQMLALERVGAEIFGVRPPPALRQRLPGHHGGRGKFFARTYVAQIRLSDGAVATFHHLLPLPDAGLPYRLVALLVLLGVSTAALSVWLVRRLTRPLVRFAGAAEGLAKNLNQPQMAEEGPAEVRTVTRAFNAMQSSLRRMIETRAQALSAVSHDLRLPITRMQLRLEGEIDAEARKRMRRDLDEMDEMIGHTLDYLRAGAGSEPCSPVNVDALLDGVIEDMEELGAQVSRKGRALAPLQARPHALRRCVANLLDNARFYGGGGIDVSVEDTPDALCVRISDRGPGIPAGELEKVFEPYFRLEASRARHTGGAGLGLPIARAIAESHGGTLTLASAPGEGTTATLVVPRRQARASFASASARSA